MFTKVITAAFIIAATKTQAEDTENCISGYWAECPFIYDCCGSLLCVDVNDVGHCMKLCWSDSDCNQLKGEYGPMYCEQNT